MRTLHLAGSTMDGWWADLSLMYARRCLELVGHLHEVTIAHVSPDGTWRFPADLGDTAIAAAAPMGLAQAIPRLQAADVAIPQLYDVEGLTHVRALLDLLAVPYVGNPPGVMALAADKARAKAVVAAAGVRVPAGEVLAPGEAPTLAPPVVVKPLDAGNSLGVTLVRTPDAYDAALAAAFAHSDRALVEAYVELGSEVRAGVLVRDGELVSLPVEAYATDGIRSAADKLAAADGGGLRARSADAAELLAPDDPRTAPVQAAARACHAALGCRHYSLHDFRIDPAGEVHFIEAGLFLAFSEHSVIARTAAAAGIGIEDLYATAIQGALAA